jgi:opacity protein-like surface antigen
MMRTGLFVILVAVAVLGLLPTAAAGQQYSVAVGPSFPTGRLADEATRGYHVQGSVGFGVPRLPFGLRTDLFYQNFTNVEREPGINVSLGGEWFRQLGFMLNAQPVFALGAVSPYVLLGAGWVREWHDDRSYSGTAHTTFNLNAGAGLDVPLNQRVGLFVEVRQLNVTGGEALRLTPPAVHPEVSFKSIPVSIGVRF